MVLEPSKTSAQSGQADPVTAAQLDALTPEAERQLRNWRITMWELDRRYGDKGVLTVAGRAMVDEEFRTGLLTDSERVLTEFKSTVPLPEYPKLKFVENTPETLTVILPPRVDEMKEQSHELDAYLESRTTKVDAFLRDNVNLTSYGNLGDQGTDGITGDGNVVWGGDQNTRD